MLPVIQGKDVFWLVPGLQKVRKPQDLNFLDFGLWIKYYEGGFERKEVQIY
jgi:hypothetical protein